MAQTTKEERLAAMQVVGELIQWLASTHDPSAPQIGNTGAVIAKAFADADRTEEIEANHAQCALDNECYECPPLRCGTFKRGPSGCEPLKVAEQKNMTSEGRVTELEAEVQRLKAGIQVATNNYGTLGTIQMIRCSVTGNPCGTDTWMEGHPCKCDGCQLWLHLRALVETE